MTLFTILWLTWFLFFLLVEGWALFNKKDGDTLSEHVWLWFATIVKPGKSPRERTGWEQFRRFLILVFMVWLTVHFVTGGWV